MKSLIESSSITARPSPPNSNENARLVRECLDGDPNAWAELVQKYKNLIFSVPIKYGLTRDEAADIFQDVCVKLLSDLKNVRDPQALPKWIMFYIRRGSFPRERRFGNITFHINMLI